MILLNIFINQLLCVPGENPEEPVDPFTPDEACKCGCTLHQDSGKIVATTRSNCGGGSVIWKIQCNPEHVIHLNFQHFTLDLINRETFINVSTYGRFQ